MSLPEIVQQLVYGIKHTSLLEYIAVFTGIASVWFARIEHIWVYPVGLVSTIIYTWLSLQAHLPGEASVNIYYTLMSIYGWILWAKKDARQHHIVVIQHATKKNGYSISCFLGLSTSPYSAHLPGYGLSFHPRSFPGQMPLLPLLLIRACG